MRLEWLRALTISCVAFGFVAASANAQPVAAQAEQSDLEIPGWSDTMRALNAMPAQALALLPEDQRNDPQVRQEVGRLILASIAYAAIDAVGSDGDHPMFLPASGPVLNTGQPNADTTYRVARITPGGVYRLRGHRGTLRLFIMSARSPRAPPTGTSAPNLNAASLDYDLNTLRVDAQGQYNVVLSATRPAGYSGDWWELPPSADRLLLRMVNPELGRAEEPTISIERIDRPAERPRPSAAVLEQRLRDVPINAAFTVVGFVGHVARLRRDGYINRLHAMDLSNQGGLARQAYYEGAYDLRDDEALILETRLPQHCLYRSVLLTNDLYETTDWYNNQSSLNDSEALADPDGVLRVVISARDPGVRNWLDTAGYPTGAIQGRWVDCETQPVPIVRKVAFRDVLRLLPRSTRRVTPEQREAELRDRRSAFQQRPLW